MKILSEMTLEELWELFPIFLTEHNYFWKSRYIEERNCLINNMSLSDDVIINHIGSTSVCSIWAKPIIDILVEIPLEYDMNIISDALSNCGYVCMSKSSNRMSFNKGYTENGFSDNVFHLHLRFINDNDELYFRDYLIENYNVAKEYEKLKLSLWKKYEHNRNLYTECKGSFISMHTDKAKKIYKNRYFR